MAGEDKKSIKYFTANRYEPTRTRGRCPIKNSRCLCGLWLILLLFISCQSSPNVPNTRQDENSIPLAAGASVYLFADVREARPIINLLPAEELKDNQVRQMIDRTSFAAAALFPKESGYSFQITAWGNYPGSIAKVAFNANKSWQKKRSEQGYQYWHSPVDRISIAITQRNVFVVSMLNDTRSDPFLTGAQFPEGFNEFRLGSGGMSRVILSCWVESPGPIFQRILSQTGVPIRVPIRQLFINLHNASSQQMYEAVIRLQLESAAHARGLASILSIAGNFTSNDPELKLAMLFLANPPIQNGINLDIKTNPMSEEEISQLINILGKIL